VVGENLDVSVVEAECGKASPCLLRRQA
jgi:hypothetical protein